MHAAHLVSQKVLDQLSIAGHHLLGLPGHRFNVLALCAQRNSSAARMRGPCGL